MDAHLAKALDLLNDTQKHQIGRAVWRLAKRLEARVGKVSDSAAEGSNVNLLRGLEQFLRTGDSEPLMQSVRTTVELRKLVGVGMPELIALSHAYLPVIRKVFLHGAKNEAELRAALGAYDVVESALLPLMVHLLGEFYAAAASDMRPDAGFDDATESHGLPAITEDNAPNPFAMVSVEDDFI